jgi:hypothetical protein
VKKITSRHRWNICFMIYNRICSILEERASWWLMIKTQEQWKPSF